MKKSVKNKNSKDIWRWVVLAPVVWLAWVITVMLCAYVEGLFFSAELWDELGVYLLISDFVILPSIAIFFVARWIAPKYKNITAISAGVLSVLWGIYFLYGLSHMAY